MPSLSAPACNLCLALLLTLAVPAARAETVRAAVAANFTAPMKAIARRFEMETGHRTRLVFGSSGKFFAQINHGAPFDVFLSADQSKVQRLEQAGLAVAGSRFTYAVGALVLWSANDTLVDSRAEVLNTGGFRHLALANPRLAPYGVAARQTMEKLGVLARLTPRFVMGENIAQTYQFVASGNAELGFVALSQVMRDGRIHRGSAWRVPADRHAPIRQDAVMLVRGKDNIAARALLDYLKSDAARSIIQAYGYRR